MLFVLAPLFFFRESGDATSPNVASQDGYEYETDQDGYWPTSPADPWTPGARRKMKPEGAPGRVLLERIIKGDFTTPSEIATGRFLREFPQKRPLLERIDLEEILSIRQGRRWVRMQVLLIQPHISEVHKAELRFILHEGHWKLENLKVLPVEIE